MNLRPALLPCLGLAVLSSLAVAQPTSAPAASPEAAEVKTVAKACVQAIIDGDLKTAATLMTDDPAEAETAKSLSSVFGANRNLRKALDAKFGAAAGGGPDPMSPQQALARFDKMEASINGDAAGLHGQGMSHDEVMLKKVGGAWKVSSLTAGPAGREQFNKMVPAMLGAMESTTSEIEAGQFKTAQEANQALMTKIMAAAMPSTSAPGSKMTTKPAM